MVSRAATFRTALAALWPETEVVSLEIGSFHVPDVMAHRHSAGLGIKPFRVPMVYAAPSALAASALSSDEPVQDDLARTEEKLLNASRVCFGLL